MTTSPPASRVQVMRVRQRRLRGNWHAKPLVRRRWWGNVTPRRCVRPGLLTLRQRLVNLHRRRAAQEHKARVAAAAWRKWAPGPNDSPGPYQPTIVCWHGTPADRSVASSIIVTTDTPEHRTPTWWARKMPDVALHLDFYPNGFRGQPTPLHHTQKHRLLGRFPVGANLPDYPLGLPRPAAEVVVVTTPWGTTTATWTKREDARKRPVYAIDAASWADLLRKRP